MAVAADITRIFFGYPPLFWGCVGLWTLLGLVVLVQWFLSIGGDEHESDGD